MCSVPALLHAKHLFGYNSQVHDNLCHVNEHTLVYLAGSVAVLYDCDQHKQRFLHSLGGRDKQIETINVSPNHQYLAVAERSVEKSYIGVSIYDLNSTKKCKTLVAGKVQQQLIQHRSTKYAYLAFSHDNKYLIGQASEPDWTLVYWEWESNKVLATISVAAYQSVVPVNQIAFHPHDQTQVSVLGTFGCLVFRLEEDNVFKVGTTQETGGSFSLWSHSWVSDTRILLGSDNGSVLLVEGSEVQQKFNIFKMTEEYTSHSKFDIIPDDEMVEQQEMETSPVTKIISFTKGFVCCCGSNTVYLFERYAGGSIYRQSAVIQVPDDGNTKQTETQTTTIKALTLSPSEDVLAIATDDRRIYTFTLSSVDINRSTCPTFEPLTPLFHCNGLRDVDTCFRKPIAVTCGTDKTIAVWNYNTQQQQLFKHFDEDILSIALHPTGLYILAGCTTKLCLMGLMIDDVRVVHEFPIRECQTCVFSHSGHLVAASQINVIHVFSMVTYEVVFTFKGHIDKIMALRWNFDDLKLVSCAIDGAIYEWDIHSNKKINEVTVKSCSFNCVGVSMDNCTSFAVGSDNVIREVAESQVLGEISVAGSQSLTSVAVLHMGKAIVASCNHGSLVVATVPFSHQDDWQEFQPISTDITNMKLTHDDKWLFTVSSDGTFGIWEVTDKAGRPFRTEDEVQFLEEILITRADLEEKNVTICELSNQVRDLRVKMEFQRRMKEVEHQEELKKTTKQFQGKITALQTDLQTLENENRRLVKSHDDTVRKSEECRKQIENKMQTENHQKLILEYQKYEELQILSHRQCDELQKQVEKLMEERDSISQQMSTKHEKELERLEQKLKESDDKLSESKQEFEEVRRLLEEDADDEIMRLKSFYDEHLREKKEIGTKIKEEMGILKQKILSLQKEIANQNEVIRKGNSEQSRLNDVIRELKTDIKLYKEEIKERNELLQEKEFHLQELRLRNDELDRLRCLLQFKVDETKSQLENTTEQVKSTEKKLEQMKTQLQSLNEKNTEKELQNSNLRLKVKTLNCSLKVEQQKEKNLETTLKNIKCDVSSMAESIHDTRKFKQQLTEICNKHNLFV